MSADLERDLREMLQRTAAEVEWTPVPTRGLVRRARLRRVTTASIAVIVLLALAGTTSLVQRLIDETRVEFEPGNPGPPATIQPGKLLGTWEANDTDGWHGTPQTLEIDAMEDGQYHVLVNDDASTMCSRGIPSVLIGRGPLNATGLVIPEPAMTCTNASRPVPDDGSSLEEALRDYTLVYDAETDTLTDSFGVLWYRP